MGVNDALSCAHVGDQEYWSISIAGSIAQGYPMRNTLDFDLANAVLAGAVCGGLLPEQLPVPQGAEGGLRVLLQQVGGRLSHGRAHGQLLQQSAQAGAKA